MVLCVVFMGLVVYYAHDRSSIPVPTNHTQASDALAGHYVGSHVVATMESPSTTVLTTEVFQSEESNACSTLLANDSTRECQAPKAALENLGDLVNDEVILRARNPLNLRSTEALLELRRIIHEQPEGERKRQLADLAAQWLP